MSDINTDVEGGPEAREAAEARWKAIEALNAAPGLTPAARRVGIALICAMDAGSRACFPSEEWLGQMAGLSTRAVRYGKDELRDAGLITWVNGQAATGPHSSRYGFNWAALERLSEEAKKRARLAVEKRRRSKAATSFRFKEEAHCRIQQGQQQSNRQISAAKAAISDTKPEAQFLPNRKPSSAEPPTYPPTRTAQPEHDAAPACAASAAVAPSPLRRQERGATDPDPTSEGERAEPLRALEEMSRPKLRPFPKLWDAFEGEEDEADIRDRLEVLPHDALERASRALATKGRERALEVIWSARTSGAGGVR